MYKHSFRNDLRAVKKTLFKQNTNRPRARGQRPALQKNRTEPTSKGENTMTAPERREARLERLFWELRRKYLAASAGRIVAYDIRSDIDALKKFAGLSIHEKAELCERAVWATDGEATADYLVQDTAEDYGSLAAYFA